MTEAEQYRKYLHGTDFVANPRGDRFSRVTFGPKLTYGVTESFAINGGLPVSYYSQTSGGVDKSGFRLADWDIGGKYTFFVDPHKGGSTQMGAFVDVMLPTAPRRRDTLVTEMGSVGVKWGLTGAISDLRNYFWADLSLGSHVHRKTGGEGESIALHLAYAWRVWKLIKYDDPDMILLFEGDVAAKTKGTMNGMVNPNSGSFAVHLSAGIQYNITNKHELKLGYNLPVFRRYNGTQFVHDGELKFTYSFLF